MSFKVKFVACESDGETYTRSMSEHEIERLSESGQIIVLSVEPGDLMQRMIDAEVKAHREGDIEAELNLERAFDRMQ